MGLFGMGNNSQVKKLQKIANKVLALEEKYKEYSNEQLKACTTEFKNRLNTGETLNDILPEAYAVVREAAWRVLNMRHYNVQILGGIALHQGRVAEMATGEGKTLVETLPAYLNALTGKGVHIVTVNEYLAKRDAEWMGKVYRFLGLTVGVVLNEQNENEKKLAYMADITYSTNNELGFDYLRDNMAKNKNSRVQRGLNFAIVDEVDGILIDEARTPLIISGRSGKSTDGYVIAQKFVKTLKKDSDIEIDQKTKQINLTDKGISKAEAFYQIENLSDIQNLELNHYINNAIKANFIMHRDENYIVHNGEVIIVDEFTGRLSKGRRFNAGLHQAIEAKEGVDIKEENQTYATITFQNFFRLYSKLSGMTGTAKTEETEFRLIYNLDVVEIPTNRPKQRIDHPDVLFVSEEGKVKAVVEMVKECAASGRPVLVGTVNIDKSELYSKIFKKEGIKHQVLNAKNNEKESEIVAQAGRKGAITIATNMAGRGTDILLGGNPEFMATSTMRKQGYSEEEISYATAFNYVDDQKLNDARAEFQKLYQQYKKVTDAEKEEVISLGGLYVIGTERHESRRIDNQLRGRAGRQGDPGASKFYISFSDEMFKRMDTTRAEKMISMFNFGEDTPIEIKQLTKLAKVAQNQLEAYNFGIRKSVLQFDDVLNKQREIIYNERNMVLEGLPVHDKIMNMFPQVISRCVYKTINDDKPYYEWDLESLNKELENKILPKETNLITEKFVEECDVEDVIEKITKEIDKRYKQNIDSNMEILSPAGLTFEAIERDILLRVVDMNWVVHIENMQIMKDEIISRQFGQQDPVLAYKKEGFEMFDAMNEKIQEEVCKFVLSVKVGTRNPEPVAPRPVKITFTGKELTPEEREAKKKGKLEIQQTVYNNDKVGRNDDCPCGSGKKFKNCCGKE